MMKKAVLLLLICVSSGWLFANHWTPNDTDYEDNMTLTGIVQINGVEQQSTTLEVGAFCGEECRGSGYLTYFFPTQRYVIQLLIFGETGDQMTFKLYDSNSGQELSLASPDPVAFNANGYGTLSEPYVLDFTGTGIIPHWVPNESEYEDNMTLTGVIQINGVEQQSTTLEVGVFCGEECRGASLATYFFPTQRYVVQLLIFGETGDQLTFKLFDHALGQELDLTSPDAVTFTTNGYGTLGNPYVLNFTGEVPFHFITPGAWSTTSNWLNGALPRANDAVFIDAPCQLDQNATVAALTVSDGQSLTLQSYKILTVTGNLTNTVATSLVIEDGAQLIHNVANVQATVRKHITPFIGSDDSWHLIALPLTGNANLESVGHLVEGQYDLYVYDESTTYWKNSKTTESGFTTLETKKGYLYANGEEVTLEFSGTLENSSATITMPLSFTDGAHLSGFNLIGNPFPCNAYLNREYYILTTDGTDINPEPIPATTPISPCTAVFVKAVAEGERVVFTRVVQ